MRSSYLTSVRIRQRAISARQRAPGLLLRPRHQHLRETDLRDAYRVSATTLQSGVAVCILLAPVFDRSGGNCPRTAVDGRNPANTDFKRRSEERRVGKE